MSTSLQTHGCASFFFRTQNVGVLRVNSVRCFSFRRCASLQRRNTDSSMITYADGNDIVSRCTRTSRSQYGIAAKNHSRNWLLMSSSGNNKERSKH